MVNSMPARDPAGTRRRLLAAAAAEFARAGFAGARVDRIAKAAAANKRMLYHYFGDKRSLLAAVMDAEVLETLPRDQADRLRLWAVLESPGTVTSGPPVPAGLPVAVRPPAAEVRQMSADDVELWERTLAWGALVMRCTSRNEEASAPVPRRKPRIRLKPAASG